MASILTGDKKLDRKLKRLSERSARKVSAAGIRAGLRVIVKGIKSEIPGHMKESRKGIGSRFKRNTRKGDGLIMAKAGAKVGINKARQEAAAKKVEATHGKGKKPGVGISSQNIGWLLKGTGARRHDKTGKSTGAMPALGAVRRGFAKSKASAFQKIKQNIRKGIQREAAKR